MTTGKTNSVVHWIGVLASAIPYFVLSWTLLSVWRDPMAWDNGAWIRYGVGLLLLEFILLHSGAFIGVLVASTDTRMTQFKLLAGLLFFYSLMAWAMAASVDSPQLLWIFAGVTLGRVVTIFTASGEGREVMMARSVFGVLFYLFAVACSIFLPIPEWGITADIVAEVYPTRGEGIWEQDPERAIAVAAGYFLLLGLSELFIIGPGSRAVSFMKGL